MSAGDNIYSALPQPYIGNYWLWDMLGFPWSNPMDRRNYYPRGALTNAQRDAILGIVKASANNPQNVAQNAPVNFPAVQKVIDTLQYGLPQDFGFIATTADQIALAQVAPPTRRIWFTIQNQQSATNIFIRYGAVASGTVGYIVQPGETHFPPGNVIPQSDIHIAKPVDAAGETNSGACWITYANKQDSDT